MIAPTTGLIAQIREIITETIDDQGMDALDDGVMWMAVETAIRGERGMTTISADPPARPTNSLAVCEPHLLRAEADIWEHFEKAMHAVSVPSLSQMLRSAADQIEQMRAQVASAAQAK